MNNTRLRYVSLRGPEWAPGQPFWELKAAAPDAVVKRQPHLPEDHIHPIRSVLIDAGAVAGEAGLQRPHLLSLQLIAGHGTGKFETQFDEKPDDDDSYVKRRHHPVGFEPLPKSGLGSTFKKHPVYEELLLQVFDEKGTRVAGQSLPSKRRWTYDGFASTEKEITTAAYFLTGPVADNFDTYRLPAAASFQHVLVEPLLKPGEQWPGKVAKAIEVPAFGLVAGRVELAVADGAFGWLGTLQPKSHPASEKGKIRRYPIALTPDGIELQCEVSFPGVSGTLSGPFLLSPNKGRLVLTLLPDQLSDTQRKQWLAAWGAVLPASDKEESLHGFRIAGNSQVVPEFRYTLQVGSLPKTDGGWPGMRITSMLADLPVEIPARHLRLDIVSPQTEQRVDGVVNCSGGYFMLGTIDSLHTHRECYFGNDAMYQAFANKLDKASTLVLAWASQLDLELQPNAEERVSPTHLTLASTFEGHAGETVPQLQVDLVTAKDKPYAVVLDEYRLAASLRDAYGMPALPVGRFDTSRPIVPGFIPVTDGWLQLPFPNLPPKDPESDNDMLEMLPPTSRNALDGFLRFTHVGDIPQVLSAFDERVIPGLLIKEAPWSITLERASRLRVAIALAPIDGVVGRSPARGNAVMDEPDLSTRGLLWISNDRPDALEAIPRLGAGPGAFFDVPLELREQESPVVEIAIGELSLTSTLHGAVATVRRGNVSLMLDFDVGKEAWQDWWTGSVKPAEPPKRYHWSRHPRMPLAAQMPMTRTATASVRPLESRDMLPFETRAVGETSNHRLAHLEWKPGEVFASVRGSWEYRLAEGWPLPLPPPVEPVTGKLDPLQVRGIGLVAFGVPGAELSPLDFAWSPQPWASLQAALRYDLPVLDEAFAMASLPQMPEVNGDSLGLVTQQELRARGSLTTAVTALDWKALQLFWGEQERRLQIARVAYSYVSDYKPADNVGPSNVHSLVGGLVWTADQAGFGLAVEEDKLPYGWMVLGKKKVSGNEALEGLEETFSIDNGHLLAQAPPSQKAVQVLGNSPSSFLLDGFLTDARGAGVRELLTEHGWWRPVHDLGSKGSELPPIAGRFSSPQMLPVYGGDEANAQAVFRLWFKDIPLSDKGAFGSRSGVDTQAWQDGHLQRSGFEWRMLPVTPVMDGFDKGSDRLPLSDVLLEPLRLEAFTVLFAAGAPADAVPLEVHILARLHLGKDGEDVHDGGNILRLVIAQHAGRLVLTSVRVAGAQQLRLPIRVGNRYVTVRANDVSWAGGGFSLAAPSVVFELAGQDVVLAGAKQSAGPKFSWVDELETKPGTFAIKSAQLKLNAASADDQDRESAFTLNYEIVIAPGPAPDDLSPTLPTLRIQSIGASSDKPHAGTLFLLNSEVEVQFKASRAALCVTTTSGKNRHQTALVEGFPECGNVQFGLVASIGAFEHGVAKLVSGRFSGSIRDMENIREVARCKLELNAIHMAGECNNRRLPRGQTARGQWRGVLTLHGKVTGRSTIAWPDVSLPTPADGSIPFPEKDSSGRRKVRVDATQWHAHDVEWVLDGHEMSFDTAGRINCADQKAGFWTATVLARHWLKRSGTETTLYFTSVDTLALGATAALIPCWPDGDDAAQQEQDVRSTFAARYKAGNPGLQWPGRGGIGFVLQGTLGKAFREAIHDKLDANLNVVVLGGFAGLIEQPGSDAVPLVRLPVLMGLSQGYLGDGSYPLLMQGRALSTDYEVAWPDSLASAPVVATFRCAVAPVTAADRDLEAAARAGARALEGDVSARNILAGALLVEQSFPVDLALTELGTTPFFLASAAGVSRMLKGFATVRKEARAALALRVLSLVSHALCDKDGKFVQRRAAVLLTAGDWDCTNKISASLNGEGELVVASDDIVVESWQQLDFTQQALDSFGAQVAMKAYSLQSRPRAALVRDIHGEFLSVDLPMPTLQPRRRELFEQMFADEGRGYMLPVAGGVEMAGVEEGFTGAVRDEVNDGSGIAGLARVANLPALASHIKTEGLTPVDEVVWLVQQRAPLYLPIRSKLDCEPIPWLVPGAPRTRLPAGNEVRKVLDALLAQGAQHKTWQPFLAEQVMVAAISERPGVLMARHMRLEVGANPGSTGVDAFDGPFPRFGRPAQSSLSVARVERTPRPARLPKNKGNAAFDRRPCASPLLPLMNHRAWVGPADSIGGTSRHVSGPAFEWTVTLVAAPETSGTVTPSWDGTLRLVAEIDETIVEDGERPKSWAGELLALLFGPYKPQEDQRTSLLASAALEISGRSLPFRTLHVLPQQGAGPEINGLRRGYATIVLDMREPSAASQVPGPALAAIAELLANPEAAPTAELKLSVHPGTRLLTDIDLQGTFALNINEGGLLPGGASRAPVTLRFPLWPVLRERGALALEPTSLLFIDPAYNAGLSAPPYEVSQRVKAQILPQRSGEVRTVFAADRQRVNRQGTVTLMTDLRFEKPLNAGEIIAIEFRHSDKLVELDSVQLRVQPRVGEGRELLVGSSVTTAPMPKPARLKLGHVHELSLGKLVEIDGTPARLAAGDMLEIAVTFPAETVEVLYLKDNASADTTTVTLSASDPLRLRLTLTDEPVAEPPPGLYAALARTQKNADSKPYVELSLPLYAQSPLPWRVDLQNAVVDFRAGLLRRSAHFVWTLARPAQETKQRGVHIVKSDRNGQTYLPENSSIDNDFMEPGSILDVMQQVSQAALMTLAADTDDKRRVRIKAYWSAFSLVTDRVGDSGDKAARIRKLLLYISGMESTFGLYRDQIGGPAKGLLQMQCGTLKDIVAQAYIMDQNNSAGRKDRIEMLFATQSVFSDANALLKTAAALPGGAAFPEGSFFSGLARDNDAFTAMILRLQLMRDSADVPDNHSSCYKWWEEKWHGTVNLPANALTKFMSAAATGDDDLIRLGLG
jgi:hypothetical protein